MRVLILISHNGRKAPISLRPILDPNGGVLPRYTYTFSFPAYLHTVAFLMPIQLMRRRSGIIALRGLGVK